MHTTSRRRMLPWLSKNMTLLAAVGGAVYLVLWIVGEAGRPQLAEKIVVFAVLAIAIGVSGWLSVASLALLIATPVLQFLGVLYPATANTWPMYGAAGIVAFVVAFRGSGWIRYVAPAVIALSAFLFASEQAGGWSSWTGNWGGNFSYLQLGSLPLPIGDFFALALMWLVIFGAGWALGVAFRSRLREDAMGTVLSAAETRLQESDFELRLSQDRARISRDVHDALAHSLAVIIAQAEGAVAGGKLSVAKASLHNIANVGRTALVEVRGLVERIQDDDLVVPQPTAADLETLVADVTAAGMEVTLRTLGEPVALAASHELAVYRVVQESLTNALKHGRQGSTATVTLDWRGPGVAILVVSTPGETEPTGDMQPGVGIEGMKERARLTGGWLTAEPADDGAFVVTAFIPASGASHHAVTQLEAARG